MTREEQIALVVNAKERHKAIAKRANRLLAQTRCPICRAEDCKDHHFIGRSDIDPATVEWLTEPKEMKMPVEDFDGWGDTIIKGWGGLT